MKTVILEQPVKKLGNSSGVIIPAVAVRKLGVEISDLVKIEITPKQKKPKFTIDELMSNTDFEAQCQDAELNHWHTMTSTGREIV
jgi:antitoxin component of MazEF toxin-antitoxin module